MKVFDCCTFNGEFDLLELRLNILDPYVDIFVIGEAELTFSGHAKPLYLDQEAKRFEKFNHKMRYVTIEDYYNYDILKIMKAQYKSDTGYPFLMAFYQKEYLQMGLFDAKDDDIIYYGDCDEIWTPQELQREPAKLEQLSYSMYLNNRTTEPWKGTAIASYEMVKEYSLNQIRQKSTRVLQQGGWHFSNMGGLDELRRKIRSYDHQEVNTTEIHAMLEKRFKEGKDFLGRDYTTSIDESQWPQYLKDNKEKYSHMLWK